MSINGLPICSNCVILGAIDNGQAELRNWIPNSGLVFLPWINSSWGSSRPMTVFSTFCGKIL